jgi:hypothetical protein
MLRAYLTRHRLYALALGGAALLLGTPEALADGCLLHPAKLPDSAIEGFRARPGGLLDDYPKGGVVMSSAVRRLAGSEVATVPELVGLAKKAGVAQIVALGAGLAGTVNVCRQKRPDLAAKITDEIRRAQNSALFAAFAASLPSRQVAAMGAPEPLPPGRAALLEPQAKAPPPQDSGSPGEPAQKAPLDAPRTSFGNGGIVRTVVRPVSPAR